jgi:glycosyltransferase involved in cell wall biosynthesis
MSRLRFCFFTTFYPPFNFGGDGIGVQRLARALVARGCEVTVVHDLDAYRALRPGPDPAAPKPDLQGLRVVSLESRLGRLSLFLAHQCGRPVVHARQIRQILRDGDFDVLTFHNVSLLGGPGLLAFGGDVPKIYMAHEHWLVCPTHTLWRHNRELCTGRQCVRCTLRYRRPPQLWRWMGHVRRQSRHVDTFIAMSEFSRQKHREFGFDRRMEVLPYFLPPVGPVSAASESSPHPNPYFLYVGRLERLKGVDDLLTAFEQYAGADLLIAGDGDHGPALRLRASGNARVVFLGRVEREPLNRYYRHATALLVPSVCYETFGVITLEAFQQRTPVLARRLGPLPEIVEGAGGGEVFDTCDELVSAMQRLQADPSRRRAVGEAGFRAYETHYSEQVVVPRFLELAAQAIERRRQNRPVGPAGAGQ